MIVHRLSTRRGYSAVSTLQQCRGLSVLATLQYYYIQIEIKDNRYLTNKF
jgi:hypothetical protein